MSGISGLSPVFGNYAAQLLQYGPLAYWPLWEVNGVSAQCLINAVQNGTYTGVDLGQTGIGGNFACPYFDGANDCVDIYSATFRAAFDPGEGTVIGFVKISSWVDGTLRYILHLVSAWNNRIIIRKSNVNNNLGLLMVRNAIETGNLIIPVGSTGNIHFAISWSASNDRVRIYLNGLQWAGDYIGLGAWAGLLDPNQTIIGSDTLVPLSSVLDGWVSDVAVFTRELSAAEIHALRGQTIYYDADLADAANAAAPLVTPTYDGSGEAVHPDVYDAGAGNAWNGHRYWMAMTPYPGSDPAFENPSILCSDDGDTWAIPVGGANPIEPAPGAGSYNDPDLIMVGSSLYFIFCHLTGVTITVYEKHSSDGVNWSAKVQLFQTATSAQATVSPALVWDGTQYRMYTVDGSGVPNVVQVRTASAVTGPWSAPVTCTLISSLDYIPATLWHLDVIKQSGKYYAIVSLESNGDAYFMDSDDGYTWQLTREPTLYRRIGQWDQEIYRGSIVWNGTDFDYWYSANDGGTPKAWRIGRTSITGIAA